MVFEDRSIHYDDGSVERRWVSGPYEIVAYERADEITGSARLIYRAYVATEPLKSDGIPGHVRNVRVFDGSYDKVYHRREDAFAACEQHQQQAAH